MNKTAIKKFAIRARRELIESVVKKAQLYGIETDNIKEDIDATIKGDILEQNEKNQRKTLVEKIKKDGFDETMEEVAYTWFNRFMAIRFMEVNGYLPSHIRVFSAEDGSFNPQILQECMSLDLYGLDKSKVIELYNDANKDKLFQYLFITQCNDLAKVLPGMFEKISNYTELLLPDGLLKDDSVIKAMVEDIPEEDWKEQVQIIGWMYQYYNTEPKAEVFYNLQNKKEKITKEKIPAATQFFTPDWIVRYMVENSLGRLWVEGHSDNKLKENWKYFIEEANQESEVEEKLKEIKKKYAELEPLDIKCIDPAIGSGHIGCYLFDVLIQIYESYGYKSRDAARMIVENNIYGLDIDERARQLAYFSVMMKVRQYDRRFLSRDEIPQPKIYAISESNIFKTENGKLDLEYFIDGRENLKEAIISIVNDMVDAEEYGSIIDINPVDFEVLYNRFEEIKNSNPDLYRIVAMEELLQLVKHAEVLAQKYDVVVTNPPYMGSSGMNNKLSDYVKKNYKDSKSDLFSVFIERCKNMTAKNGYQGMITQQAWMFLSSYEKLRKKLEITDLINMIHLGPRAFEEIDGEKVQTTSFTMRNSHTEGYKGTYARLIAPKSQDLKEKMFLSKDNRYIATQENFNKIPGNRIGYWLSKKSIENINKSCFLNEYANACTGMQTGRNPLFVRNWYEVYSANIINNGGDIWNFYMMGGKGVKWYGNIDKIILWKNNGDAVKKYKGSVIRNEKFFGKKGISWKRITSSENTIRYLPENFIFDQSADSLFPKFDDMHNYLLGIFNTKIISSLLELFSATLNLTSGTVSELPIIFSQSHKGIIDALVEENIEIAKQAWDMHETSWDFVRSPLLINKQDGLIESSYEIYKEEVNERFEKLKANEEELNRIFIGIYGLEDELTPEVSDKDITIAKVFDDKKEIYDDIKGNKYVMTREDVIKNFLSYFIGCVMGRYSLDEDGLVFAGGEFDERRYKTFVADEDGIIPFTDEEYFPDDIIVRLEEFLKVTFGEEHIKENLEFIASELKGKSSDSSREKIRNYFMNDFYEVHYKMYNKCPIYWLCDSGELGASKNLLYMHRYKKDSIARLRIRYVFEIQDRYKQALERINSVIDGASGNDRVNYQKKADRIKKLIIETEKYEEKVQHLADSYIELDLDDGVQENQKIFKGILAEN